MFVLVSCKGPLITLIIYINIKCNLIKLPLFISGPAVMERPAAPVAEGHHPLVQPVDAPDQPHEPQNDVLAAPPAQGRSGPRAL